MGSGLREQIDMRTLVFVPCQHALEALTNLKPDSAFASKRSRDIDLLRGNVTPTACLQRFHCHPSRARELTFAAPAVDAQFIADPGRNQWSWIAIQKSNLAIRSTVTHDQTVF